MSLASQVSLLATRIGQEVKAQRPIPSRLTAAATSTSTGYGATGLTVTLTAGKVYEIRAGGSYRTAATTTGLGLRLGGTATVTGLRYTTKIWNASTALVGVFTALLGALLSTAVTAANTDYAWEIDGEVRVNAAGTLTLEFASEVNASQVTIQPDSYLIAQLIA